MKQKRKREVLCTITFRKLLYVVLFVVYYLLVIGIYCMKMTDVINTSVVIGYLSRIRISVLVLLSVLLIIICTWFVYSRTHMKIKTTSICWLDKFIYKEKQEYYIDKYANVYKGKPITDYAEKCMLNGRKYYIRKFNVYNVKEYEDVRQSSFLPSDYLSTFMCCKGMPSGYGHLSKEEGGTVNVYKLITTDTKNMLYVCKEVPFLHNWIDVYAFENKMIDVDCKTDDVNNAHNSCKRCKKCKKCTTSIFRFKYTYSCFKSIIDVIFSILMFLLCTYLGLYLCIYVNMYTTLALPIVIIALYAFLKQFKSVMSLCYKRIVYVIEH